jgi:hypothetical protein
MEFMTTETPTVSLRGNADTIRNKVLDGLIPRDEFIRGMGWSDGTYYKRCNEGMPFVKLGQFRYHDPVVVHAWIVERGTKKHAEARRPGRPRKAAQ